MKAKLTFYVTLMVSATLCLVIFAMVATLMMAVFDLFADNFGRPTGCRLAAVTTSPPCRPENAPWWAWTVW